MNPVAKIQGYQKFGIKPGLDRIEKLTDLLDKPQRGLDFIHIGGTNGKGSVSSYIYSVLRSNGYSVGSFTSPFMDSFKNAIVVDDMPLTEDELGSYYVKIESAVSQMTDEGYESPTEFEVITALAILHFSERMPDFVIMEVGLGGKEDSTNILGSPILSIITSVSLDHCEILGDTKEKIAEEKAGIIKQGIPVVTNVRDSSAARVVARRAYRLNAPLIDAARVVPSIYEQGIEGSKFSVNIGGINYPQMEICMVGEHQVSNAVCALTAIEQLRKKGKVSLDSEKTVIGLRSAKLEGRFDMVSKDPLIIMDGAHNEESAAALAKTIKDLYPKEKILTIFTLMKDKEPHNVIKEFASFTYKFVIADILPDKAADAEKLSDIIGDIDHKIVRDREVILDIIRNSKEQDMILITGSLYLIRDLYSDVKI